MPSGQTRIDSPSARVLSSHTRFSLALASVVVNALRSIKTHAELVALMETVTREMRFRHYALIHLSMGTEVSADVGT